MTILTRLAARLLDLRSVGLTALLTFLWLCATTWTRPLFLPDEGRYAGVAWNMLGAGEWLVPLLDGLPFFHKPPLFYWITAAALKVFGANEWAARLASVLCATFMVALFFWFLKRHAGGKLAAVACVMLAVSPFLFGAGQYANLDMTVAAMIAATVMLAASAVLRMEAGEPWRAVLVLAYAAAGLGFLSKGLIGVVLPGGVLFFWLLGRGRYRTMLRLLWWPGPLVFLAVSLPWMIAMQARYAGFFDYYIVYQHFRRFLETGFNNPYPFWFYVPVLLALTLPWSVQLWRLASRGFWRAGPRSSLDGLMLSWLVVVVVFFSIPQSKLVGYVLPALPPLFYFLALPFARALPKRHHDDIGLWAPSAALRGFTVYLAVSVAICLAAVLALVLVPQPSTKALALKMRAAYTPADQVYMLDRLRYDLAFYLKTATPLAVVADWDDPGIQHADTWRKEVHDAGRFDPDTASRLLVRPADLLPRLCADRAVTRWLVGERDAQAYPFLADLAPHASDGKLRVWRVPAGTQPTFCAGTPRTGQE